MDVTADGRARLEALQVEPHVKNSLCSFEQCKGKVGSIKMMKAEKLKRRPRTVHRGCRAVKWRNWDDNFSFGSVGRCVKLVRALADASPDCAARMQKLADRTYARAQKVQTRRKRLRGRAK
eukprot:3655885-Pleurochrysis_carterae.AAC.1